MMRPSSRLFLFVPVVALAAYALPALMTSGAGAASALDAIGAVRASESAASAAAPLETSGVAELDWISGGWIGSGLGGQIEETWSSPSAGSMIGTFRLVQDGKPGFYQVMLIEQQQGSVMMHLQHYSPGFKPWEKDGALTYRLTENDGERAVFEGTSPKQTPSRLVYKRKGEGGALGVFVETSETLGAGLSFEVLYERTR